MLRGFELFEVFTDGDEREDQYRALQREITGLNANPTYIVLDSKTQLEVARSDFTNEKAKFVAFIEQGLTDVPVFRSVIQYIGLDREISETETMTILERVGAVEAEPGEVIGQQRLMNAASGQYETIDKRAYSGEFWAKQKFRVPEGLAAGPYTLRAKLIGQIWRGDEFITVESATARFVIQVGSDPATAKR